VDPRWAAPGGSPAHHVTALASRALPVTDDSAVLGRVTGFGDDLQPGFATIALRQPRLARPIRAKVPATESMP